MVRDLAMAFAFGDHPSVAAFFVAFRLSNLFRRLLGEGPFQSAFIPCFEGLRVKDEKRAAFFFRKLSLFLTFLLCIIIILSEISLFWVCHSLNLSDGAREILKLTGWLMPGLLFICLYGLNISLLQCHGSFFIPSFAPFVCNIIWIGGALYLRFTNPFVAMPLLAKFIVVGFFFQWLFTFPKTFKNIAGSFRDWFSFTIPKEVGVLAKSFTMGAVGVGAVQINAFFDVLFARFADLSGPVYLWYSIRLEQLVLAIFGIACVSTVVPRLSRALKSGDYISASYFFSFSFKRILIVMIPSTFAIVALGLSSVNLLYGRGEFSSLAVMRTTFCLWAYGIGLLPATMVILYSSIFYARGDFKTPTLVACLAILLNILLNAFFVFIMKLGAVSVALATSLSAWFNFWYLRNFYSGILFKEPYSSFAVFRLIAASALAALFSFCVEIVFFNISPLKLFFLFDSSLPKILGRQILIFFTLFFVFASTLLLCARSFCLDLWGVIGDFLLLRRQSKIK